MEGKMLKLQILSNSTHAGHIYIELQKPIGPHKNLELGRRWNILIRWILKLKIEGQWEKYDNCKKLDSAPMDLLYPMILYHYSDFVNERNSCSFYQDIYEGTYLYGCLVYTKFTRAFKKVHWTVYCLDYIEGYFNMNTVILSSMEIGDKLYSLLSVAEGLSLQVVLLGSST